MSCRSVSRLGVYRVWLFVLVVRHIGGKPITTVTVNVLKAVTEKFTMTSNLSPSQSIITLSDTRGTGMRKGVLRYGIRKKTRDTKQVRLSDCNSVRLSFEAWQRGVTPFYIVSEIDSTYTVVNNNRLAAVCKIVQRSVVYDITMRDHLHVYTAILRKHTHTHTHTHTSTMRRLRNSGT